uniref:Uncharacterized protein n=1 Tax=Lotharella oceanica TaxID=641309 RepID=A0A7S2XGP6_9EUKA|mmetsp:Transcript_4189/g.8126  ORF Transcript_4189/g.8126 Transcript_4189/m.8126 type:complete len:171 (+) Transcript_4189:346-858(+)
MKFKKANSLGNQHNTVIYNLKTTNLSPDNYFCKRIYSHKLNICKSGSLIPFQSKTYYTNIQRNFTKIAHLDILITKLKPKQKIFFELHAIKGYGYTHNKFSPIIASWFSYYSSIFFIKNLNYLKKEVFIFKKKLFLKKNFNIPKIQKFFSLSFHNNYFINVILITLVNEN